MEAGGVGEVGRESVRAVGVGGFAEARGEGKGKGEGRGEGKEGWGLDERQVAVLRYTDAMTVGCRVPDEVFAELKRLFSEREVVEITATVAAYNCVSRFLVALDVGEMNGKEVGGQEGKGVGEVGSGH